ncbi:Uncharacterized protein Adt_09987 [Abeliophyllum distichum]|uniref:Uncharacterized protein n=1 Tax=Abeliophyllum distichum TaxID=126358 RepID=A0ABD1UJP0_9LAMI
MAGSATGRGCNATFISLSVSPPSASHKFPIIPKQLVYTNKCSTFCISIGRTQISSPTPINTPRSSSSSSTPVVVEEEETGSSPTGDNFPVQSESARDSDSLPSIRGCKACGREEIESGCNGEGRIQGTDGLDKAWMRLPLGEVGEACPRKSVTRLNSKKKQGGLRRFKMEL